MSSIPLSSQAAANNIEADLTHCAHLLNLLQQEREALKTRDTDLLEAVIRDKSEHLQGLENGAKQRSIWLAHLETATPKKSASEKWEAYLQSLTNDSFAKWQNLRQKLAECQVENEINGRLLARNQQVFGRLLSLIRGQNDAMTVYNAKGGKGAHYGRQSLGEA